MSDKVTNKERHNLWFNMDKPYQREAHEYLKLLGKSQTEMISLLIHNMLTQNGVTDVSVLSKEEAKKMRPSSVDNVNALVDIIVRAVNGGSNASFNQERRNHTDAESNDISKAQKIPNNEPEIIDEYENEEETEYNDEINDDLLKGLMGM